MKSKIAGVIILVAALTVIIALVSAKKEVLVFYPNSLLDPQYLDCSNVFPVSKSVHLWQNPEKSSLKILLIGPNEAEKEAGYFTNINDEVTLNSLVVKDGTMMANFSNGLNENVAGSCKVINIRSQIEKTLKQFSYVRDIVILVEGEKDEILQP
jgi:spore germination protein GerM